MGTYERVLWVAVGFSGIACAGLTMRGADSVKPGREPPGDKLALYQPSGCQNAGGTPTVRNTTIQLTQLASGNRVLIEKTPGYDTLIVKNVFVDRGEIAFQAVLKSKGGRMMLHDFRLPNDLNGPGRMAVASSWREVSLEGGGFRGYFDAPVMTCQLAVSGPEGSKPAAPTEEEEEQEATTDAGAGAPSDIGTPEPRDRYAVGDMVAVDVQGKLVKAKVVQAVEGDRYYVEYQTAPSTSEWVDKAKIRGKL